jgi:hypothetical protein
MIERLHFILKMGLPRAANDTRRHTFGGQALVGIIGPL